MELTTRFLHPPDDHFFLFGPRGTGKSTWLRKNYGNAYFFDLLDDETFRKCLAYPEYIKSVVDAHPEIQQFIIDEVQKIPKILDSVHQLIEQAQEQNKSQQFILTGSSARKLKRESVNLLGGRALLTHFHPYIAAELGQRFNLESALEYGLIPLIVEAKNPRKKLQAYISLYLKEEVQNEGLVRNLGAFSRFMEKISFSHGSILNQTNIARECQVSNKLVENYISILEDLLLAYKLPVFTKRAKREPISHPKFYLFDAGVFNILRPKGPLDRTEEINGAALEGLVLQHLRAWRDYAEEQAEIYFWRTRGGSEVDFILYGSQRFVAIEVKNTAIIHRKDLNGLKAFHEDYPESSLLLLYRGKEKLVIDNITCWPVEEFLVNLFPDKWPLPI